MAQNTYWGSFEEISKYNVSLNYAERLWLAWYTYMQNDVLATGIMSFVMHEAVYFGRSLPWIIIDMIPWFRRYKIQPVGYKDVVAAVQILTSWLEQNPHRMGTVAVCSPRPLLALYRRTSADLVLPPYVPILRSKHHRPVPEHLQDGIPNRRLLRPGGYLALLDAPRHALRLPLQAHPQDPPPVLCAFRSRR